jgi:uncharacterized membrane protein YdcZ (DUF606 family)
LGCSLYTPAVAHCWNVFWGIFGVCVLCIHIGSFREKSERSGDRRQWDWRAGWRAAKEREREKRITHNH